MYRKKSVPWSGKQPQFNARIDTNNPITRGLVFAYNPATGTGFAVINGLLKSATTIGSTNIANSIAGRGTVFSGNTANRIVFASPISSGDMTLVVVATPSAASSGQAFFGLFNSALVNASSNYLSIESGPVYGALSTDNSNWVAASGRAPVANEIVTLGASFTASGKRDLYINGAFSASSATARNPTGLDVVSVGCYNGGSASGWLSPLTGRVFVSLVFNRVLSASEHKALSENPWQVFEPIPQYFPVSASAPQIVYPNGDVAGGTWLPSTGTDLYACIDETAASDADYIYTTVPGAYQEFYFPDCGAVDPSTGGHVRYRIPAGTGTITTILKQGSTTLQTLGTHTLTGSAQDIDITISASVANSDNLRVGFTASA